jgi:POT family proton-dependent oligopeptide transporter
MVLATVLFWVGRHRYVRVPPAEADPHSFLRVVKTALLTRAEGRGRPGLWLALMGVVLGVGTLFAIPWLGAVAGLCLALVWVLGFGGAGAWLQLERARGHHPEDDVDGVRAVLRVLVVFALITPFWSLFDQKASTWILQGEVMALPGWSWFTSGSQMQALNPAMVMVLIPLNNTVLFPLLRRLGVTVTPLRRMGAGIAIAGLAWILVALLQLRVDSAAAQGLKVPVLWQAGPYLLLTLGEVLVSATGLEFAYSQAPARLKSVVTAFFQLSVTVGNLWVLLVNVSVKSPVVTDAIKAQGWGVTASQMFFFAGFALVAALAFALYARRFPMADYYRKA